MFRVVVGLLVYTIERYSLMRGPRLAGHFGVGGWDGSFGFNRLRVFRLASTWIRQSRERSRINHVNEPDRCHFYET